MDLKKRKEGFRNYIFGFIPSFAVSLLRVRQDAVELLPSNLPKLKFLIGNTPQTDDPLPHDCGYAYEKHEASTCQPVHFIRLPSYLMVLAGIASGSNRDTILFTRGRCFTQMLFMCNDVIGHGVEGFIYGPSGTGKSLTALYVAVQLAVERKWNVLWAHLESSSSESFWKCLQMHPDKTYSSVFVSCKSLRDVVDEFETTRADIGHLIILDGIRFEDTTDLPGSFWLLQGGGKRRVIKIFSDLTACPQPVAGARSFRQHSWTLTEYQRAILHTEFDYPHDESDSVLEKHGLAGGCARWMFALPADLVRREIDSAIQNILEDRNNIQKSNYIGKLFGHFADGRKELISPYAKRAMASRLGSFEIQSIAEHPFIRSSSHCFEIFFYYTVFKALREYSHFKGTIQLQQISWSFKKVLQRHVSDLTDFVEPDVLVWVYSHELPAYYGFVIRNPIWTYQEKHVEFLQITAENKQDIDFAYIKDMMNQLRQTRFKLNFIVPRSQETSFRKGDDIHNVDALESFGWPTDIVAIKHKVQIVGVDGWGVEYLGNNTE